MPKNNKRQVTLDSFFLRRQTTMKKYLTLLFILISCQIFGQNYKIFNASSKKLFTDSVRTFSIYFDSVKYDGIDSIYYNFSTIADTLSPSDSCNWWGGQSCEKQNKPVWVGKKINYNNHGLYQFFPISGDTLSFDFTKNIGDTSIFYKDAAQKFFIVYEKFDTMTVLNYYDSARFYKILHTDLAGNNINSPLNGKKIIIDKNLGLIQFFQVDSFPQLLKPFYLIGNGSPDCGLFQLTDEIVYDFQPGDEIQFSNYKYQPGGPPPPWTWSYHIKYVFLTRIVTIDSLKYKIIRTTYDNNTYQTKTDTTILKYYRHNLIFKIPFEYFDGNNRRLYLSSYCGMKLWTYNINPNPYIGYCVKENCWGGIDTGGPMPTSNYTYIAGLGEDWQSNLVQPPPSGYESGSHILYFKKNGIPCGSEVTGTNEITTQPFLLISPNPFSTQTTLHADIFFYNASLTVYNSVGQQVKQIKNISGQTFTFSRDNLPSGLYFLRLTEDKKIFADKIVIVDN